MCEGQCPLPTSRQVQPHAAALPPPPHHQIRVLNMHCTRRQEGTLVMPREPEVAAESRSAGSGPMCGDGGPVPLGVPLRGGMPLGVGPGPGEMSSAMWWRRLTSSAAMAAAPSLSLRCSTCTHSQLLMLRFDTLLGTEAIDAIEAGV